MRNAYQPHWLEEAIGTERDPQKIAVAISQRPQFIELIRVAIRFASQHSGSGNDETRIIAEHIASILHNSIGGFSTSH